MGGHVSKNAQKDPKLAPLPAKEITQRKEQDMEQEFEDIYSHSKVLLASLTANPCEHFAERVKQCLDDHSNRMMNCFADMGNYQKCVSEQLAETVEKSISNPDPNTSDA